MENARTAFATLGAKTPASTSSKYEVAKLVGNSMVKNAVSLLTKHRLTDMNAMESSIAAHVSEPTSKYVCRCLDKTANYNRNNYCADHTPKT